MSNIVEYISSTHMCNKSQLSLFCCSKFLYNIEKYVLRALLHQSTNCKFTWHILLLTVYMYMSDEQSVNHIKRWYVYLVTRCTGHISANSRPHQLHPRACTSSTPLHWCYNVHIYTLYYYCAFHARSSCNSENHINQSEFCSLISLHTWFFRNQKLQETH